MNLSARRGAIQRAQALLKNQPVYLDTETTGTGPNDNILEISVIADDGTVLFDSLVKPVGTISPEAMAIHGITTEMVVDAPGWRETWASLEFVLTDRLVGIYNAEFDMRMMQQSHARNMMRWVKPKGMETFCIMKLYAQFHGDWNSIRGSYRWQSLDVARRQCNLKLPNSHRAADDALLTRAVLHYMAGRSS